MLKRTRAVFLAVVWTFVVSAATGTPSIAGGSLPEGSLLADLDGQPIDPKDVGSWFCNDFGFPRIHCYISAKALESAIAPLLSASGATYVTVFSQPTFAGNYMYISQDYTVLAGIGWNDRISSFIGRSSETGHFYTDWFYGGTSWYFCCNTQEYYLGAYDKTFSSVHRG